MAARALDQALRAPALRPAKPAAIVFHPALAAAKPAPIAPLPRRTILNAAAHEAVLADIRLATWLFVAACCIGAGLAIGLHFDDILADVRLVAFNAEEPRWLWGALYSM